jgi:hypothetical protein
MSLNSDGEVVVEAMKASCSDEKERISNKKLIWKGRVKGQVKAAGSHWALAGVLKTRGLSVSEMSKRGELDKLYWQGKAEIDVSQVLALQLHSEDLTLTDVMVEDKSGPSLSSRDVKWRGDVLVKGDQLPQVDGDLVLNKFRSIVNHTPLGTAELVVKAL